jgi:membrane peptidoglycan carboxypeptidase
MTSMLRDVVDRGTGTAVRAAGFRGPAAGKTGTTNDAADVWFVGYTPDLVGAVWIGFDNPRTIFRGATGGTLAAPVWGRIMRQAPSGRGEWRQPAGVVTAEVERGTGRVVSEHCPASGPTYTEFFVRVRPAGTLCPSPHAADGIEWPELEELRRERENGALPEPPLAGSPITRDTAPTAASRAPAAQPRTPAQPPRAEPEPEPEPRPDPPVLGRPIEPSPPPAADTTGGDDDAPGDQW